MPDRRGVFAGPAVPDHAARFSTGQAGRPAVRSWDASGCLVVRGLLAGWRSFWSSSASWFWPGVAYVAYRHPRLEKPISVAAAVATVLVTAVAAVAAVAALVARRPGGLPWAACRSQAAVPLTAVVVRGGQGELSSNSAATSTARTSPGRVRGCAVTPGSNLARQSSNGVRTLAHWSLITVLCPKTFCTICPYLAGMPARGSSCVASPAASQCAATTPDHPGCPVLGNPPRRPVSPRLRQAGSDFREILNARRLMRTVVPALTRSAPFER